MTRPSIRTLAQIARQIATAIRLEDVLAIVTRAAVEAPNTLHCYIDAKDGDSFHRVAEATRSDAAPRAQGGKAIEFPVVQQAEIVGRLTLVPVLRKRVGPGQRAFLSTLAAQLGSTLANASATGLLPQTGGEQAPPRRLQGVPGAAGVARGRGFVVTVLADIGQVPQRQADNPATEELRFSLALQTTVRGVRALSDDGRSGAHDIMEAYALMLESEEIVAPTLSRIRNGQWAPRALSDTIAELCECFARIDDPYLRSRGRDVHDLGTRLLRELLRDSEPAATYPNDVILVGSAVSALDMAEAGSRLVGVVCEHGSNLSHVAILAQALGVPAVVGTGPADWLSLHDAELILDGDRGLVYPNPDPVICRAYDTASARQPDVEPDTERDRPAQMIDGPVIQLMANTGLAGDISPALEAGAGGIGLYRTEFGYLTAHRFPTERELESEYHTVLSAMAPRPVTLRTLDIGGDKMLSYFPIREDNPGLGWRGLRVTLDLPDLFSIQLRAAIRASAGSNNLKILFPMVTCVSELRRARTLVADAYEQVARTGRDVAMPPVGAMIETPAAVLMIRALLPLCDFVAVGSNDLTQYVLAADRNNERVATLCDSMHPAVLLAIAQVATAARQAGVPVSLCGAMASDPLEVIPLLGMGFDQLSMTAASIPTIRRVIRRARYSEARAVLDQLLTLETAAEVRAAVRALDWATAPHKGDPIAPDR
ncbi:MAG: phosphotransferase system enzyme I (PtsP) [Myxococcota bacterium]|jgi:phosphotransferase system enzyme I (PtsP)